MSEDQQQKNTQEQGLSPAEYNLSLMRAASQPRVAAEPEVQDQKLSGPEGMISLIREASQPRVAAEPEVQDQKLSGPEGMISLIREASQPRVAAEPVVQDPKLMSADEIRAWLFDEPSTPQAAEPEVHAPALIDLTKPQNTEIKPQVASIEQLEEAMMEAAYAAMEAKENNAPEEIVKGLQENAKQAEAALVQARQDSEVSEADAAVKAKEEEAKKEFDQVSADIMVARENVRSSFDALMDAVNMQDPETKAPLFTDEEKTEMLETIMAAFAHLEAGMERVQMGMIADGVLPTVVAEGALSFYQGKQNVLDLIKQGALDAAKAESSVSTHAVITTIQQMINAEVALGDIMQKVDVSQAAELVGSLSEQLKQAKNIEQINEAYVDVQEKIMAVNEALLPPPAPVTEEKKGIWAKFKAAAKAFYKNKVVRGIAAVLAVGAVAAASVGQYMGVMPWQQQGQPEVKNPQQVQAAQITSRADLLHSEDTNVIPNWVKETKPEAEDVVTPSTTQAFSAPSTAIEAAGTSSGETVVPPDNTGKTVDQGQTVEQKLAVAQGAYDEAQKNTFKAEVAMLVSAQENLSKAQKDLDDKKAKATTRSQKNALQKDQQVLNASADRIAKVAQIVNDKSLTMQETKDKIEKLSFTVDGKQVSALHVLATSANKETVEATRTNIKQEKEAGQALTAAQEEQKKADAEAKALAEKAQAEKNKETVVNNENKEVVTAPVSPVVQAKAVVKEARLSVVTGLKDLMAANKANTASTAKLTKGEEKALDKIVSVDTTNDAKVLEVTQKLVSPKTNSPLHEYTEAAQGAYKLGMANPVEGQALYNIVLNAQEADKAKVKAEAEEKAKTKLVAPTTPVKGASSPATTVAAPK